MEFPKNFKSHTAEQTFTVAAPQNDVFTWLLKKSTFTSGQLPPYKVEFLSDNDDSPYMSVGDKTNHHGPGIQFAGVMTSIVAPSYRKLNYNYGSYALSFRWARPSSLEIYTDDVNGTHTKVTIKLVTHTHYIMYPVWSLMMRFFWQQFAWNTQILWFVKKLFQKSLPDKTPTAS